MENLAERFRKFISDKKLFAEKDKLLVAVSGGLDSVVLCELCYQSGYDFVIAHANFNLRGGESMRDEEFVKKLAEKYSRRIYTRSFETEKNAADHKQSIQVAARNLRYDWFRQFLPDAVTQGSLNSQDEYAKVQFILTAHHLDDNIETLLLNFLKGTGIAGLHGIQPRQGRIIRPLLFAWKEELRAFANLNQLEWVEDSSNASLKYTRNQIRNKLIPLISEIVPEARSNMADNLNRFEGIETLYKQALDQQKKRLIEKKGAAIQIPVLKLKKSEPLHTLVFEIFRDYDFSPAQVPEIISLLDSESGRFIFSSKYRLLKDRGWLILTSLDAKEIGTLIIEEGTNHIKLPGSDLHLSFCDGTGYKIAGKVHLAEIDASQIQFPLLLRKWKKGDYFYPLGMRKKKKLSRFFIDEKISIPAKENMWVLETQKKIVWIVGMRIDDRFAIRPNTSKILKIEMRVS
ncbi:MAG: tRNA lysidine(34) synthetase TilS [Chitinophagales bacterium]